jgi:uncharacterized protein YjbI with pentapeptide repeats
MDINLIDVNLIDVNLIDVNLIDVNNRKKRFDGPELIPHK